MSRQNLWMKVGAVFLTAAITGHANAGLITDAGNPIIVPFDHAVVQVEFVSFEAFYTGHLYFLGTGDSANVTNIAGDTKVDGLGQFLFNNHAATAGSVITLEGLFNSGDILHFAYNVVAPSDALDLFRTDVTNDQGHFAWNAQTGLLGIEDLRPDHPWDKDFNDVQVRITFAEVPGPGVLCAMALGVTVLGRRRRRV